MIFARLQTVLLQKISQDWFKAGYFENGFDGARIAAATQQRAVCAFAQDEAQGANQDRFAGSGLTGKHVVAGLQFEQEVRNQREVLNAQSGQHSSSTPRLWGLTAKWAKENFRNQTSGG